MGHIGAVRFAAVLLACTIFGSSLGVAVSAEPATDTRYPTQNQWDPMLREAPRPSPLPLHFDLGARFHRSLVQLPDGGLGLGFVDLYLPAGVQPLVVERQYRSGLARAGVFGIGWASNLDVHLEVTESGAPRIIEADGRATGYDLKSPGLFAPIAGSFPGNLVRRLDGGWARDWVTGTHETFDDAGRLLTRTTGTDALRLSYFDPASAHPSEITDAVGHTAKLAYRDGLLTDISFPQQRSVRYAYRDRTLTAVTDPTGRETRFAYAGGKLAELALPAGETVQFAYATDGRLARATGPGTLTTSFAWHVDDKAVAVTLTASASTGSTETLLIGPASVDPADWKDGASGERLALALIHSSADVPTSRAYLLDGKALIDGNPRAVLDPSTTAPSSAPAAGGAVDLDRWHAQFTPAMAPTGDPQIAMDAAGRPVEITPSNGLRERWVWDDADRIVSWTNAAGTLTRYAYDLDNRMTSITRNDALVAGIDYDVLGSPVRVRTPGGETTLTYDAAGNLTEVRGAGETAAFSYDRAGRLTEGRLPGSEPIRIEYDAAGRRVAIVAPGGASERTDYDDHGRIVATTDVLGQHTTYSYDASDRLLTASLPDGSKQTYAYETDGVRVSTRYADGSNSELHYDSRGRVDLVRLPDGSAATATFDANGLPAAISDRTTHLGYRYDDDGRVLAEPGPRGERTYTYDRVGRPVRIADRDVVTTLDYGADGGWTQSVVAGGETTALSYDADGRLIAERDAVGETTAYTYSAQGNLAAIDGPFGAVRYTYDDHGRPATVTHSADNSTASINHRYVASGQLAGTTYEDGTSDDFVYDETGRVTHFVDRLGNQHSYAYDVAGRIATISGPFGDTRYSYDAAGRVAEVSQPGLGPIRYGYPAAGELSVTEAGGATTRLSVNPRGQLVLRIDALGNRLATDYDAEGRVVAVTGADGGRTTWSYGDGEITRRSAEGRQTTYRMDAWGRPLETRFGDAEPWRGAYDAAGRISRMDPGDAKPWTFRYDHTGRLEAADGPTGVASYRYDSLGRVTAYSDAFGTRTLITYDAAGRTDTIRTDDGTTIRYHYDRWGLIAAIDAGGAATTFGYDDQRRLSTISYPNGMRAEYSYEMARRPKSVQYRSASGALLYREVYTCDPDGNVTALETPAGASRFRYDVLSRLVEATGVNHTPERYDYDASGQIVASHDAIGWRYDRDQHLIEWRGHALDYDAAGNLTGIPGGPQLDYNAAGQLVSAHLPSGGTVSFAYDAEGHRIEKRLGHTVTRYSYAAGELLSTRDDSNKTVALYVPGLQPGAWTAVRKDGRQYYPIRSGTGNLVALVDDAGAIVERFAYESYGRVTSSEGQPIQPPSFAGHTLDLETGLYDFGVREYSPELRRFISPDPDGADQDGSNYVFALANPMRFGDASGANGIQISVAGGLPLPPSVPQSVRYQGLEKVVVSELRRIAGADPTSAAGETAAKTLQAIDAGEVTPAIYNYAIGQTASGRLVPNYGVGGGALQNPTYAPLVEGAPMDLAPYQEARVYRDAVVNAWSSTDPVNPVTKMAGVLSHEATHVEQGLAPPNAFPGFYDEAIDGYRETTPYRRIHEILPYSNQATIDPTLGGATQYRDITDIIDNKIATGYRNVPGYFDPATGEQVLGQIDPATGDLILNQNAGQAILPQKTVFAGVEDQVDSLKALRQQLAIERGTELQDLRAAQAIVDREAELRALRLEQALMDAERPLVRAASELEHAPGPVSRALGEIAARSRALLGEASPLARRALGFAATKLGALGRFAKYAVPVSGEVLMVKDVLDATIWLGQSAGQAAADMYLGIKHATAAILDPLANLADQIASTENADDQARRRRKRRRDELWNRTVPQPIEIIGLLAGEPPPTGPEQPHGPDMPFATGRPPATGQPPAANQGAGSAPPGGTSPGSLPTPGNSSAPGQLIGPRSPSIANQPLGEPPPPARGASAAPPPGTPGAPQAIQGGGAEVGATSPSEPAVPPESAGPAVPAPSSAPSSGETPTANTGLSPTPPVGPGLGAPATAGPPPSRSADANQPAVADTSRVPPAVGGTALPLSGAAGPTRPPAPATRGRTEDAGPSSPGQPTIGDSHGTTSSSVSALSGRGTSSGVMADRAAIADNRSGPPTQPPATPRARLGARSSAGGSGGGDDEDDNVNPPDAGATVSPNSGGFVGALSGMTNQMAGSGPGRTATASAGTSGDGGDLPQPSPPATAPTTVPPPPASAGGQAPPSPSGSDGANGTGGAHPATMPTDEGLPTTGLPPPPAKPPSAPTPAQTAGTGGAGLDPSVGGGSAAPPTAPPSGTDRTEVAGNDKAAMTGGGNSPTTLSPNTSTPAPATTGGNAVDGSTTSGSPQPNPGPGSGPIGPANPGGSQQSGSSSDSWNPFVMLQRAYNAASEAIEAIKNKWNNL